MRSSQGRIARRWSIIVVRRGGAKSRTAVWSLRSEKRGEVPVASGIRNRWTIL